MSLIAERARIEKAANLGPSTGVNYQIIGGALIPIRDNSQSYIHSYSRNDTIYSIVNLILDKVRIAPWNIFEVVDQSSLKAYHAILRKKDITPDDYRKARDLFVKALKPVNNPGKWGELLKYPNEQDTFQDLVANGAGYKMLTGNRYLYGDPLEAGANKGIPNELWTMPSQFVQVLARGGFPAKVLGYQLAIIGNANYTKEQVMHEKYMNYDFSDSGAHLVGMAPMKAALSLTNRSNSALDTTTAKFQNGGLETIIYLDEQGVNKFDGLNSMAALKQKLINEYTGPDNYGKIGVSGYKVGAIPLGLSPVDLEIIEAEKWDLRRFCNLFGGVPSQLLNDPENKTYNNQKEGEKALTSRAALSLLTSFRDCLNRQAHQSWKLEKKWIIDFDMTVYTELQEDMTEMMRWLDPLAKLTALPPNRILELMGLEKMNDKVFDEPWITTAMGQPLSEWKAGEVDNILNNGDEGDD